LSIWRKRIQQQGTASRPAAVDQHAKITERQQQAVKRLRPHQEHQTPNHRNADHQHAAENDPGQNTHVAVSVWL
jgi:hypothetical protein